MAGGVNLGSVYAYLKLDTTDFRNGLEKSKKSLGSFSNELRSKISNVGSSFTKIGGILSASVTAPIVAFGISSVKAFQQADLASARLRSSFKGIGGITKEAAQELEKFAAILQRKTSIDDEAIKSGMAMLGTFRLTVEQVKQLTPAMLDAAAALEKTTGQAPDMEQLAIQIGKAASSGNVGMLKRWGLALTEAQQEAFKVANQQERVNILVKAFAENFGGMAAETASTLTGKYRLLGLQISDFKERVGEAIVKAISPYIDKLMRLMDILNQLSDSQVRMVVGILGVLAAIGPLMIVFGQLLNAVSLIISPLGLVVVALSAIAAISFAGFVKSSGGLEKALKRIGSGISGIVSRAKEFAKMISKVVKPYFGAFVDTIKGTIGALKPLKKAIADPAFKEAIKYIAVAFGMILVGAIAVFLGALRGLVRFITGLVEIFKGVFQIISGIVDLIIGIVTLNKGVIVGAFNKIKDGILNVFKGLKDAVFGTINSFIQGIVEFFYNLYLRLVGRSIIPDMINAIVSWFWGLPGKIIRAIASVPAKIIAWAGSLWNAGVRLGANVVNGIVYGIKNIGITIYNWVKVAWLNVVNWAESIWNAGLSLGKGLINGIINGIKRTWNNLVGWLNKIAARLKGHSPPKVGPLANLDVGAFNIGKAWREGFLKGIGSIKGIEAAIAVNNVGRAGSSIEININGPVSLAQGQDFEATVKELGRRLANIQKGIK